MGHQASSDDKPPVPCEVFQMSQEAVGSYYRVLRGEGEDRICILKCSLWLQGI